MQSVAAPESSGSGSGGSQEAPVDTLIVGAGPAGLTAGYLLTRERFGTVLVVEDNDTYVGGISRTERHGGYSFDIGGHRFFSKSQDVEALWREMLPGGFIERPRSSRIIYRNKLYSYPLRAFEALAKLGHRRKHPVRSVLRKGAALPQAQPRFLPRLGCQRIRREVCSASSSRPTPRRCGA